MTTETMTMTRMTRAVRATMSRSNINPGITTFNPGSSARC